MKNFKPYLIPLYQQYKNLITQNSKSFLIMLLTLFAMLFTQQAEASHFRGGTITWRVTDGTTVEFTVTSAWRSTLVSTPNISDPSPGGYTMISNVNVSTVNGVTTRVTKFIKTFSSNGPHRVSWGSCCRIGGLSNSSTSGSFELYTIVDFSNGNENSPVSSLPAIVNVSDGLSPATFSVPANDLDGDNLTYRLATTSELFGNPPPGMSINSTTGQISVNTSLGNYIPNQLWYAGVVISDGQAEIYTDFLLQITNTSTPPVFNYGPTPPDEAVYQTSPGNLISFQVEAQDIDPGGTIALLFASGLPGGASFNQSSGNPAQSSFSWNPTATDFGTYVLNFIAQDNIGVQSSTSVTIQVSLNPVFDVPPTPAEGTHNFVVTPGTTILYNVQASDPDPNDVVQIVNVTGKNMMTGNPMPLYPGASLSPFPTASGNPTSGSFSWPTQGSDWGHRHVIFTAQDSYGDQATHEVSQLINTVPSVSSTPVTEVAINQTYTYNIVANDPDIAFGDTVDFVPSTPLPTWLTLTTDPATGTAVLTGTPGNSDLGPFNISLLIEDTNHHYYPTIPTHDFTITITQGGPCDDLNSYDWIGNVNSDWTEPLNWAGGFAPGLSVHGNVDIFASSNYPVLMVGQDLYIDECSTVIVGTGSSLTVNPNVVVTNDGVLDNAGGTITFESDATGSAYIGSGTGTFNGDFTIERYIPSKRAYRQLASPVNTSTPISSNWQMDTHITGSTSGANGFDATTTGNPSMYIFDNVANNYIQMSNTNTTNINSGTVYHTLVRGDRTTDLTNNNAPSSETTLRATGELTAENDGTSVFSINLNASQFVAFANPFQAPVNMNTILTTGATNISTIYYWIWDPTLGYRGAYTAINASTGVASTNESDANQFLQAGQSGWVSTDGAGQSSLSFTQASKATSESETLVFKTSNKKASKISQLRLSLYETSDLAANKSKTDGMLILFNDQGNNAIDANDAPKLTNLDENIATNNDGILLSIENRAAPMDAEEIQLEINTYRGTNYSIILEGSEIKGTTAYLFDNYTNISTEIPETGKVNYNYTVDLNIPNSVAGDRFKIIFKSAILSAESNVAQQIKMYPNPSNTGKFYLNIPTEMNDLEVTIYNVQGAKLYSKSGLNSGNKISINTGTFLSQGIYFVKMSSKGRTTTKKLNIN
ncbi:MAG: T9SS type A sorting domain-containing protein [Algibacter sp.]|uniref:T9SS type A sorting domain-containing protein n=1 Tax=Algibacter sp. TaxID=1872428 RepID=UPI00329A571A